MSKKLDRQFPCLKAKVVFLNPVDSTFWSRLGVSVDFGLSLTKAQNTRQFNTRTAVSYLTDKWSSEGRLDILRNAQDTVETTKRTEFGGDYRRFIRQKWFGIGAANFLQSDELGLDLRSTVTGGLGRHLVRNNRWRFSIIGGAGLVQEIFVDPNQPGATSAEAVGTFELNAFDIGAIDILTSFSILPSLTQSGRVRMDLSTDFTWEIISDLFFRVGFSDNFDSSPTGSSAKNDYVFSTSVGWSY